VACVRVSARLAPAVLKMFARTGSESHASRLSAMLTATTLAEAPDFHVRRVVVRDEAPEWSEAEVTGRFAVVLIRAGAFRMRSMGREALITPALGYFQAPGDEQRFAYDHGDGDVATSVALSEGLWQGLAGDSAGRTQRWLHVDGRLELAHHLLARETRGDDAGFAVAEALLDLVATAVRRQAATTPAADRLRPGGRARQLADAARDAIAAGHPAARGLVPLARLLHSSPFHLSRVFREQQGVSLTQYRNRVRISRALERIDGGERDLAGLALDLGFADQAHLSRTMKQVAGDTPGRVRELLTAS
jgi:AraC-like DNA-binding protein